jgi:hypothetical protein
MANLLEDISGRIEYGLFFSLDAYLVSAWSDYSQALISLSSNDQPLKAVAIESIAESFATGRCSFHSTEQDVLKLHEVEVQLFGGSSDGLFLSGLDGYLYVSERIADAVMDAGFCGSRFANVTVQYNSSHVDGTSLLAMCFDGCSMYRPQVIAPTAYNQCHICGFGPIACPICGYVNHVCPQCDTPLVTYDPDDSEVPIKFRGNTHEGRVLSLERWDGSDFLGGRSRIVSGRVVDLLFSFNPMILCARGLRCYVGDRPASEFDWLRSLKFGKHNGR